jgi:hypothetical protein
MRSDNYKRPVLAVLCSFKKKSSNCDVFAACHYYSFVILSVPQCFGPSYYL